MKRLKWSLMLVAAFLAWPGGLRPLQAGSSKSGSVPTGPGGPHGVNPHEGTPEVIKPLELNVPLGSGPGANATPDASKTASIHHTNQAPVPVHEIAKIDSRSNPVPIPPLPIQFVSPPDGNKIEGLEDPGKQAEMAEARLRSLAGAVANIRSMGGEQILALKSTLDQSFESEASAAERPDPAIMDAIHGRLKSELRNSISLTKAAARSSDLAAYAKTEGTHIDDLLAGEREKITALKSLISQIEEKNSRLRPYWKRVILAWKGNAPDPVRRQYRDLKAQLDPFQGMQIRSTIDPAGFGASDMGQYLRSEGSSLADMSSGVRDQIAALESRYPDLKRATWERLRDALLGDVSNH